MKQLLAKGTRFLQKTKNRLTPKTWPEKSIVFYAPMNAIKDNNWTPLSLKKGVGGSEIAAINLCREWVKLGYKVVVYNQCGEQAGIYEGVEYRRASEFNPYDTFDILIVWRFPWIMQNVPKANEIWLELQEILLPEQVTPEKLAIYSKVFVKSQDHKRMLPDNLETEKICVIPNGVSKEYAQYFNYPKEPYKLIYASNYSRGLESMLEFGWPIIQREIPDAQLHIYYGWPSINKNDPNTEKVKKAIAWRQKMEQLMQQPGIYEHGKIGVEDLIKEKATCAIHYYGCNFRETDCVSVRESALVGCVPVTTSHAALGEKPYCVSVSGSAYQPETHEKLAYQIVELLKDQAKLSKLREKFQPLAQQETWDNIAQAWIEQIR